MYNSPASTPLSEGSKYKKRGCSSVVERNLAKVDVVGSNPIIRSSQKKAQASHADVAQW